MRNDQRVRDGCVVSHRGLGIAAVAILCLALLTSNDAGAADNYCRGETDPLIAVELMDSVRESGHIPVIIELNVDWSPEARLADEQVVADQRSRISAAQDEVETLLKGHEASVKYRYRFISAMAITVDESALDLLLSSSLVCMMTPDRTMSMALENTIPHIGADNVGLYSGNGWAVAILDTGVDTDHPFLGGRVVAEACFSTTGPAGPHNPATSTLCPNGLEQQIGPGAGINFCNDLSHTGCIHGTHVAGIAAGAGVAFSGVAPAADIISIQVFSRDEDSATPDWAVSLASDQMAALEHVYGLVGDEGYDVAAVNMSLGTCQTPNLWACDNYTAGYTQAIENLYGVGTAVIAAAGNVEDPNGISLPACRSRVISVGNSTHNDYVFYDVSGDGGSNVAPYLDFFAPGSYAQNDRGEGTGVQSSVPLGGFARLFGTSMASPHVAGAWALLRQRYPTHDPQGTGDHSVEDILTRLIMTGQELKYEGGSPQIDPLGRPRIQVDAAMAYDPDGAEVRSDVWLDFGNLNQGNRDWLTADGSYFMPYESLADALGAVDPGGTIRITNRYPGDLIPGDSTDETPYISTPMTIQAVDGPICIGTSSPCSPQQ